MHQNSHKGKLNFLKGNILAIAVSDGSHIGVSPQKSGTILAIASRNLQLWFAGMPYLISKVYKKCKHSNGSSQHSYATRGKPNTNQILFAPAWRYSIHGKQCGSLYQQPVVKSIPTCNVGIVIPVTTQTRTSKLKNAEL